MPSTPGGLSLGLRNGLDYRRWGDFSNREGAIMQIFNFDAAVYAAPYQRQGWVLIPHGASPDFYAFGCKAAKHAEGLAEFAIAGKKQQARVTLPDTISLNALFDVICAVSGLDRDSIVLSERHLQTYDPRADPFPQAHKDRRSSQVSVGITLRTTSDSRLHLWPQGDRTINEGDRAIYCNPDGFGHPVTLEDRARDVVMFGGSSTWHRRAHAAGVTNLYLKFNDFGHDPLGEDPRV